MSLMAAPDLLGHVTWNSFEKKLDQRMRFFFAEPTESLAAAASPVRPAAAAAAAAAGASSSSTPAPAGPSGTALTQAMVTQALLQAMSSVATSGSSSGRKHLTVHGGTRLELALDEMALSMTPTRQQLHVQQNMRDRLIAIECQDEKTLPTLVTSLPSKSPWFHIIFA